MIIIPANTLTGGFDVANSLRFNDGSNDYLNATNGTPTNNDKCTLSVWVKRSALGGTKTILGFHTDDNNRGSLVFDSDKLDVSMIDGASTTTHLITTQVFRDVSAWYHIVLSIDTTQATASSRVRIYVNGSEVTSFGTETNPSQNQNFGFNNSSVVLKIGQKGENNDYFDGYMAETVFIDGQQLAPDQFGEFDEDSGIWKPIDVSGLTFGTNGFYLDFEDSAALGDDVSGNGNDFTVNNLTAIDQSTDTCTNNFNTINPLAIASNGQGTATLSNGNLTMTSAGSSQNAGTFAPSINSNSKWYYEFRCGSGATDIDSGVGWGTDVSAFRSGTFADLNSLFLYTADGRLYGTSGWTAPSTAPTYTNGDIIGCTVDLENNEIKWYKNGTLAYTISSISFLGDVITPYSQFAQSGAIGDFNFGSPSFTISSGNTDGNGYGNFEYAVPSGYYSLNSKNLAEYG